ncbi:glycosyltransferase [Candidatus Latescibacterota bacterium]
MEYLIHFFIFVNCIYILCVVLLIAGVRRVCSGVSPEQPSVSVIIAARNEQTVISSILSALKNQDYPEEMYEVIVADDRSADGTFEVLKSFSEKWKRLRIIRIDRIPEHVSPKKHALSEAILQAQGDIILQTDADCLVPRTWISGMVKKFEKDVGIVTGMAPYLKEPGLLNSFVRHEYLWNAVLSAGSIALGRGTHASGRNLAFRRDAFEKCGGYGSMNRVLSGDDTLLLHRISRLPEYRVVTVPDKSTHVYTRAPKDWATFLHQRIRHMSTGKYFDPSLIAVGFAVYGFHILLITSLIFSFFSPPVFFVFAVLFLLKCAIDACAARSAKSTLGLDIRWKPFFINELFITVYMAVMPVLGLVIPVKWKENT